MHRAPHVLAAAVLLAFSLAAGCGPAQGSGKLGTRSVAVAGEVHAVRGDGKFELTVRTGPAVSLSAEADENLLDLVAAETKDGLLRVSTTRDWTSANPLRVTLTAPAVHGVAAGGDVRAHADLLQEDASGSGGAWVVAEGAAHVTVDEVRAKTLEVRADGAVSVTVAKASIESLVARAIGKAVVEVSTTCTDAKLTAEGSGRITGTPLHAKRADVVVAGAARVDLDVDELLHADAMGPSEIRYGGNPKVQGTVGETAKVWKK